MIPHSRHNSVGLPDTERQDLLKVARKASAAIGTEFFFVLTNQLADVLGADCVYVGEFVSGKIERVRPMAAWREGQRMEVAEFPLAGTPDAEVAAGRRCTYMGGVQERFPDDRMLRDLNIEAFAGVPLDDAEGRTCGIIVALFRPRLGVELPFVQGILDIFVPRASAELNRKRGEETLRQSEERYRTFVQLNPDACWRIEFDEPIDCTLDEDEQLARILRYGRVAECNDALVQRLGLERSDQLIGAGIIDLVQDRDFMDRSLRSLIRAAYQFSTLEARILDRNGTSAHYLHTHWGIIEGSKVQRVWGWSRDITELRTIEAQFRHAQRLESIGRLAAGVAHDFNNLLTIIRGYSAQLLENMKDTVEAYIPLREIYIPLREIQKAAEKGAALSNQLLTFGRKQDTELRPVDLKSVVAEDEEMLRRIIGKGIELTTTLEPSLGLVQANMGCMHQVILNLAVNARDAMPRGGRLIVSVSNVDLGDGRPLKLAAVPLGRYVRLSVSDTGVGMSEDVQAHLFEPFYTTKETHGTGLGLSTVYGIVRQSKGYIVVDSELHKGSTFAIFLPREPS